MSEHEWPDDVAKQVDRMHFRAGRRGARRQPKAKLTEDRARRIAANQPGVNAYACPLCPHWHVGTVRPTRRPA